MPNESSLCGLDKWGKRADILLTVFYSLISVFGVLGNGLVIFMTGLRIKKTFTTVFFLNLAIADFIATFFLILTIASAIDGVVYRTPDSVFGKEMCQFISTIKFLNLYSSVYFLVVISIGRYISVRYPMWARNHQTSRLASWVALGVWILSSGLSCAFLYSDIGLGDSTKTLSEDRLLCFGVYGILYSNMSYYSLSIFLSHIILSFILPFIVMISCYGAIIFRLRRSQFGQPGKVFKAIIAVTVAFFVCWFPLNLFFFMKQPSENCVLYKVFVIIYHLSDWLAYFNSCLNPILYVFIGQHYRESLRCSVFSALENAFHEENSPGRIRTEDNSTAITES